MITQNVDRIVTKKFFEAKQKIFVTSIFRTIQGEGPYAGYPAIFVRLAGCNFGNKDPKFSCAWCDTNFQIDSANEYSVEELVQATNQLRTKNDILVITGGEPTLQPLLLDYIKAETFKTIQIETNGTQSYFFGQVQTLRSTIDADLCIVVSPKANETSGGYGPLAMSVIENLDCLKFVVSADPSSAHHNVPEWALSEDVVSLVSVSPMAVYKKAYVGEVSSIWDTSLIDAEATAKNYNYAAQYALKNNLRLSLQTHLFTAVP